MSPPTGSFSQPTPPESSDSALKNLAKDRPDLLNEGMEILSAFIERKYWICFTKKRQWHYKILVGAFEKGWE